MPERRSRRLGIVVVQAVVALVVGCGGGDRAAPNPADLVIAKTDTDSGDEQVGVAGAMLGQALRVVVTRDGVPVENVPVLWATSEGTLTPAAVETDANGISTANWKLKDLFAQQVATAGLDTSGPPAVVFTAIATPDPADRHTVLVRSDGGNRFDPAELTIVVGETVSWFWPEGSTGHNVVPGDGDAPPQSGPLVGYPKYHSFRFQSPGVYHYHCMAHGGVGGAGMSGVITVMPRGDQACGSPCGT